MLVCNHVCNSCMRQFFGDDTRKQSKNNVQSAELYNAQKKRKFSGSYVRSYDRSREMDASSARRSDGA